MRFRWICAVSLLLVAGAPAQAQQLPQASAEPRNEIAAARGVFQAALRPDVWPPEADILAARAVEAAMVSWPAELEAEFGPRSRVRARLLIRNAVVFLNDDDASLDQRRQTITLLSDALAELRAGDTIQEANIHFFMGRAYGRLRDDAGAFSAYERAWGMREHLDAIRQAELNLSWTAARAARAQTIEERQAILAIYDQAMAGLTPENEAYRPRLQRGRAERLAEIAAAYAQRGTHAGASDLVATIDAYTAAAAAFEALDDVNGGYYRLVVANLLLARAQRQWGSDAEAALALAEAQTSIAIERYRYVWFWARTTAINALALGGELNDARASALGAEIMASWSAEDGTGFLHEAAAARVRDADTAAERDAIFLHTRNLGAGSPAFEAQTLDAAAWRIYNDDRTQRGTHALDRAIELWREAVVKAEAGAPNLAQIRLNLAGALYYRANNWDRDAQETVEIAESLRRDVQIDGDGRSIWFRASMQAVEALAQGADQERARRSIEIAEQVIAAWSEGDDPNHLAEAAVTAGLLYTGLSGSRTDNYDRAAAIVDHVLTMPAARQFSAENQQALDGVRQLVAGVRRRPAPVAQGAASVDAMLVTTCEQARSLLMTRWLPAMQRGGERLPREDRDLVRQAVAVCEVGMDDTELNQFGQDLLMTYLYVAMIDFDSSVAPRALIRAERALSLSADAGMSSADAELHMFIALFRREIGGDQNARVVADAEAALAAAQRSGLEVQIVTNAALTALGYFEAGDFAAVDRVARIGADAASRALGTGLNRREVLLIQHPARKLFEIAATARARVGDFEGALAYSERGRAQLLSAALGMNEASLSASGRAELERLRNAIRQREAAIASADQVRREEVEEVIALRQRAAAVLDEASLGRRSAARNAAAIVAPIVSDGDATIVVRPSRGSLRGQSVNDLDRDALTDAAQAWRQSYRAENFNGGIDQFRESMEGGLGVSIRAALAAGGVRPGARITLLPDGAMSLLPIALLRDPATGRTLLEDYEVTFAPSMRALESAERRVASSASANLVAFWNDTLPFAESESAFANARFQEATIVSPGELQSTRAAVQALNGANYWHFAVHGVFNWENPQASELQLTSSMRLTLAELLQSGEVRGAPRLIVLSACESGLVDVDRDPNEFIGLPAAFLEAGGAGVIASLWPVSDLATSLLFARFYEVHLGERQLSAPAALREAQLWLRDASRDDLLAYVDAAVERGDISDAQGEALAGALLEENSERPFSGPLFWGAWVYYGA